jgi:hypothetical protein
MKKLFIYLLLALLLVGCESKKEPIPFEQFSSKAIKLDYRKAMLKKLEPRSLVEINGKVVQILKENNKTQIRVNTKKVYDSYIDEDVLINFDISLELIEDDIVQVYAQYNGVLTYETRFFGERTVPHLIGHFYKGPSGSGNFPDRR